MGHARREEGPSSGSERRSDSAESERLLPAAPLRPKQREPPERRSPPQPRAVLGTEMERPFRGLPVSTDA